MPQISRSEFFQICTFVKEKKETIESENFNKQQTRKFIKSNLAIEITNQQLNDVFETLGEDAPNTNQRSPRNDQAYNYARNNCSKIRKALKEITNYLEKELGADELSKKVHFILNYGSEMPKSKQPNELNPD